ncbi:MAG: ankyrin repeat domain-containing protein [Patescibacteria group bacterium]|jgi:hypothetical protein
MLNSKEKKLLKAVSENNTIKAITILHTNLKNINYSDQRNNTALLFAVKNNNLVLIKEIISRGGNVNVKNINGITPIILAIINNQQDIVTILNEAGAKDDEQLKSYLLFNKLINGKNRVKDFNPNLIDSSEFNNYSQPSLTRFLSHLAKHCGVPLPGFSLGGGTLRYTNRMGYYDNRQIHLNKIEGSYSTIIAGVLVHEFAHYYIDLKQIRWIDGSDLNRHEYLVDNTAVFLGFGEILLKGKEYYFHSNNSDLVNVKVGYSTYNACLEAYNYFRIIQKIIEL